MDSAITGALAAPPGLQLPTAHSPPLAPRSCASPRAGSTHFGGWKTAAQPVPSNISS